MPPKSSKKQPPANRGMNSYPIKKAKHVSPVKTSPTDKYTNWIYSAATRDDDLFVSYAVHWNVDNQSAYLKPINEAFKDAVGEDLSNAWNILGFFPRRDPASQDDRPIPERVNSTYPWLCFVSQRRGPTDTPATIGTHVANSFKEFGKNNLNYTMPPKFAFKRDMSVDPPRPLSYYLCDSACLVLLKSFYAGDNSKEDVMGNADIMTSYFGSIELGREILEPISDESWGSIA